MSKGSAPLKNNRLLLFVYYHSCNTVITSQSLRHCKIIQKKQIQISNYNKTIKTMAKMTKAQLSAQGKKITSEAKRIRKASPNKKWTTCMKEAGKKFKKKK